MEKNLLYFSSTTHNTSDHKKYGILFLCPDQFSDIIWVPWNSIQLWYYLPGVSIRSVRGLVPQDRTHFRCQSQVTGCHLYFCRTSYKFAIPWPHLWFDNLLGWLTGVTEMLTFTIFSFKYNKGYRWTSRWRGTRRVPNTEAFVPVELDYTTLPTRGCMGSPNSIVEGFLWRLYHIGMTNY